ncbi:hypothetical protein LOTGIDRAFT_86010, partial [Lottia gigantea]
EINITTTWNGGSIDHKPVKIHLTPHKERDLKLTVQAPYFADPAPSGQAGRPFPELWNYEVVELFLMNNKDRYLEIELSPHGQHLVLLLSARRKMVKDELPLVYSATIKGDQWHGEALIPLDYLPPNITKFNAYAIHGVDEQRVYEAYSPAIGSFTEPDFHRLEFFKP